MKVKEYADYEYGQISGVFEKEFDDDATDEEIEQAMRDIVFEHVDWYWEKE